MLCCELMSSACTPHRADLDPIYYCELLKTCVVKDDGDAKIQSLTVKPVVVPYGQSLTATKSTCIILTLLHRTASTMCTCIAPPSLPFP